MNASSLVAATLLLGACSSSLETPRDFRGACRDHDPRLEAALAPKTDIVVRLRAVDRDALEHRLGVKLFPGDVAWLQIGASDREQPCCGAKVEAQVVEGATPWTERHGKDLWKAAGLVAPTPAVFDPKYSVLGAYVDFLTRLVTAGTLDFRARGTEEWFPKVLEPGLPGTGTPEQQLALARLLQLDRDVGRELEIFAGWADDGGAFIAPDAPSTNRDATLVVDVTLKLDADAWMKDACTFTLEKRIALPPGPSVSARLRAALEKEPELRFGSLR